MNIGSKSIQRDRTLVPHQFYNPVIEVPGPYKTVFCFAVWFGPRAIRDRSFLSLSFGVGVVTHPALSRLKRLQDLEEEDEDENVRHVKHPNFNHLHKEGEAPRK